MKFVKKNLVSLIVCALGLVAVLLLFAPCVKVNGLKITYSGFQAIFGHSEKVFGQTVKVIDFSFGGLVSLILLVAAMALSFVKIPMQRIIVGVLFVVSGIMIMLIPNMAKFDGKFVGEFVLYLSGILALISGLAFFGAPYVLKNK